MHQHHWKHAAVWAACVGMLLPQPALGAAPATADSTRDVALLSGGVFVGQLVDARGQIVRDADVAVAYQDAIVATTKTDAEGRFAVRGLRGGVHTVVTPTGHGATFRLWVEGSAPPAAAQAALVIADDSVVAGQCFGGSGCGDCCDEVGCGSACGGKGGVAAFLKKHPLLIGAGVAAAIAIPLAVADDDS